MTKTYPLTYHEMAGYRLQSGWPLLFCSFLPRLLAGVEGTPDCKLIVSNKPSKQKGEKTVAIYSNGLEGCVAGVTINGGEVHQVLDMVLGHILPEFNLMAKNSVGTKFFVRLLVDNP